MVVVFKEIQHCIFTIIVAQKFEINFNEVCVTFQDKPIELLLKFLKIEEVFESKLYERVGVINVFAFIKHIESF